MHNVAGVLQHCKQSLGFPWVSPPPALESLQVAAARLGLFVLRPVQLLPSGDGPSGLKPGAVWIRGDFEQVQPRNIRWLQAGLKSQRPTRIYANMGIKLKMCWKNSVPLTVHNATLT